MRDYQLNQLLNINPSSPKWWLQQPQNSFHPDAPHAFKFIPSPRFSGKKIEPTTSPGVR